MKPHETQIKNSVKPELSDPNPPDSYEKMNTLFDQIKHFQGLLESTRSQIIQLEGSIDFNLDDIEQIIQFQGDNPY